MILLNNENNFNIWALYPYIAFFNISRIEVSVFLTFRTIRHLMINALYPKWKCLFISGSTLRCRGGEIWNRNKSGVFSSEVYVIHNVRAAKNCACIVSKQTKNCIVINWLSVKKHLGFLKGIKVVQYCSIVVFSKNWVLAGG